MLALSFGAGQALNASNAASSHQTTFAENPITGVTLPAETPTTAGSSDLTPSTLAASSGTTATTATVSTPTTAASPLAAVCSVTEKIVAGGLPGPITIGPADQLQVTLTKPSWANHWISYDVTYALPARLRLVSIAMPVGAIADKNGTIHVTVPIGPESQGGVVSVLAAVRAAADDACRHDFTVDYNGANGLVGGITQSLAKNLLGIVR